MIQALVVTALFKWWYWNHVKSRGKKLGSDDNTNFKKKKIPEKNIDGRASLPQDLTLGLPGQKQKEKGKIGCGSGRGWDGSGSSQWWKGIVMQGSGWGLI